MTWPSKASTLEVVTMNRYGAQAQKHWQTDRATEYAQLEDPERFFIQLGEQIAAEIDQRRGERESQTSAGQTTDFLANLGSLNEIQTDIEMAVMSEMVYAETSETTS